MGRVLGGGGGGGGSFHVLSTKPQVGGDLNIVVSGNEPCRGK